MPSRTRLLFVDPAVAPDIGAVHQGKQALHSLHAWAERCVGLKLPRPPGNLVERARYYWNRVPGPLRKRAQLYIIRERRDTPWRFSDANPWRRGLRPVAESKAKVKWGNDWAGLKPLAAQASYTKTSPFAETATPVQPSDGPWHAKPRKKALRVPPGEKPKERLKVGIWS